MNVAIKRPKSRALAAIAPLLQYPRADYAARAAECKGMIELFYPAAGKCMAEFCAAIADKPLTELEELYTRTFDMAPLCTPYITTYLYGEENFERGALMTQLAERYAQSNFDLNGELPDHIAVILEFAPHFSPEELSELIEYCLSSPLEKMCTTLKDAGSMYYFLMKTALAILPGEQLEDCQK